MFDIGFFELTLIGVIALLVLGPEKLPHVARTAGLWLGRARRMIATVKADIDHELRTEELKSMLQDQQERTAMYEIVEETKEAIEGSKTALNADSEVDQTRQAKPSTEASTLSPDKAARDDAQSSP
jgi:sec-independent protein translocase protein TatB